MHKAPHQLPPASRQEAGDQGHRHSSTELGTPPGAWQDPGQPFAAVSLGAHAARVLLRAVLKGTGCPLRSIWSQRSARSGRLTQSLSEEERGAASSPSHLFSHRFAPQKALSAALGAARGSAVNPSVVFRSELSRGRSWRRGLPLEVVWVQPALRSLPEGSPQQPPRAPRWPGSS